MKRKLPTATPPSPMEESIKQALIFHHATFSLAASGLLFGWGLQQWMPVMFFKAGTSFSIRKPDEHAHSRGIKKPLRLETNPK